LKNLINSQAQFDWMFFAGQALDVVTKSLSSESEILDIGVGRGDHALELLKRGHWVTGVDVNLRARAEVVDHPNFAFENCLFEDYKTNKKYDCIWASHVLEHVANPGNFLKSCLQLLKEDGVLAITVPPLKHNIVGGHVSLWNAGLLLYNLVLAGVDCKNAAVKTYGYNISVVVRNTPRPAVFLKYDSGDIDTLAEFFPKGLGVKENFNGSIQSQGWGAV